MVWRSKLIYFNWLRSLIKLVPNIWYCSKDKSELRSYTYSRSSILTLFHELMIHRPPETAILLYTSIPTIPQFPSTQIARKEIFDWNKEWGKRKPSAILCKRRQSVHFPITPSICNQEQNPPSNQKAHLTRNLTGHLCHPTSHLFYICTSTFPFEHIFMLLADIIIITEPSPNKTHTESVLGYYQNIIIKYVQKWSIWMKWVLLSPEIIQLKTLLREIIKTNTLKPGANHF